MFPPNEWPQPVSSYVLPVEPPTAAPAGGTLVCASWNPAWTPFILGAMTQLLMESTWRDDIRTHSSVFRDVRLLMARFGNAEPCVPTVHHVQTFNFAVSDGGWFVSGNGVYIPDVGFRSVPTGSGTSWYTSMSIQYNLPVPKYVDNVYVADCVLHISDFGGTPVRVTASQTLFVGSTTRSPIDGFSDQDLYIIPLADDLPMDIGVGGNDYTHRGNAVQLGITVGPFPYDPSGSNIFVELHSLTMTYFD